MNVTEFRTILNGGRTISDLDVWIKEVLLVQAAKTPANFTMVEAMAIEVAGWSHTAFMFSMRQLGFSMKYESDFRNENAWYRIEW